MYLTRQETAEVLAIVCGSQEPQRVAFGALSDQDKDVCCERAAAELDAVRFNGSRRRDDQEHAWPRIDEYGDTILRVVRLRASGEPWSLADLPFFIRAAAAVQAGRNALRLLGQDFDHDTVSAASQGIVSHSSGGVSTGVERVAAQTPRGAIDPTAWAFLRTFVAFAAEAK